jgi:hypothetical protein
MPDALNRSSWRRLHCARRKATSGRDSSMLKGCVKIAMTSASIRAGGPPQSLPQSNAADR